MSADEAMDAVTCELMFCGATDWHNVGRNKTNHKSAILGQDGFLGTMSEYEGLFDAFPVEDTATPGAAGDCESNLTFVLSCRWRCLFLTATES